VYDGRPMNRVDSLPSAGPEWVPVLFLTVLAAVERLAGFGRLGLDHFDEGIYASAGSWSLTPGGLAGLDAGLIPYAPPGYPTLVGLAYRLFGPSDLAAIAVSVLAGIATVPVVAWIGRRTFGPTFGVAAAGFAAASMPHVAFSRMALTDATFLLAWLAAMAAGGWFLEKPAPGRAVMLGLSVGLAQLVKYNGWLAGAIVAATALLGPCVSVEQRSWRRFAATAGWGALAGAIGACVYAPWFLFVERHGGYAALLNHQRGYFDGPSAWPANWLLQLNQLVAFTAMGKAEAILGPTLGLLGLGCLVLLKKRRLLGPIRSVLGLFVVLVALSRASTTWWLGLGLAAFFMTHAWPRVRLLGVWWAALTILTPMYHPYARLWLPLEAAGWLTGGLILGIVFAWSDRLEGWPGRGFDRNHRPVVSAVVMALIAAWVVPDVIPPGPRPLPGGVGEPRDSLRIAGLRIVAALPAEVRSVRILGRPPLFFYVGAPLARRGIASGRLASSDDLVAADEPGWAIVDAALLRQEGDPRDRLARLVTKWDIVAQEPTTLSKATLLDVDPRAAVGDLSARDAPLILIRRRSP
jgi:dolichyl-phosphate-mannose-protein mannosyltransferase